VALLVHPRLQQVFIKGVPQSHVEEWQISILLERVSLGNLPFTGATTIVPASAEKKGIYTFAFDTAQNALTLSELRITCTVTCGSRVPYMWTFFLSTFPERRKVPSSLKMW
jgi:hypothetical protein